MDTFNILCHLVMTLVTVTSMVIGSKVELYGCCRDQAECDLWLESWHGANADDHLWFRLLPQSTCESPQALIRINLMEKKSSHANATVASSRLFYGVNENDEPSQLTFFANKDIHLRIRNGSVDNIYANSSYCIKRESKELAEVRICLSGNPWYKKCCPIGEEFHLQHGCVEMEVNEGHKSLDNLLPIGSVEDRTRFYPVISYPNSNCSYQYISTSLSQLNFTPTPWKMEFPNHIKYYDRSGYNPMWRNVQNNYCVDLLKLPPEWVDNKTKCPEQDILIMCEDTRGTSGLHDTGFSRYTYTCIYIVCLGIAMFFLAATALGFKIVEKRNIQKQTMLFYITSQILFYFFIMIIYMDHLWHILSSEWCMPIGVLAHFFGLSTFTWLSVINFDLWWTFRILQPRTGIHWTRLAWYAVFATACPALIIAVSVSLHYSDERSTSYKESLIYPGYGKEHCFLSNAAQLYYFYMPIGLLLLANVLFYSCTSYRLCSLYKKSQHSTAKKHRKSCQLLLKLFFVMGTVWIMQVMHAMVEPHQRTWYWTIVDLLALSQAIAIFIIFICKRESWRILTKKYPLLKGICFTNGMEQIPETTPEGSTRLSRTEGSQRKSVGLPEFQEPSEIIQLP